MNTTLTRRSWIRAGAAAGAALSLRPGILSALDAIRAQGTITRTIPGTDERLPIVGLGSSATFSRAARGEDFDALREVLRTFVDNGGAVFDTAPSYGASEEVAGRIADELDVADDIFWATKVNVAGRGGGSADADAARAQIERSFERFDVPVVDLIQVHNMGDPPTQVGVLEELKAAGRIRYLGITSTRKGQYPALAQAMRDYPLDFIGVDYAVDNLSAAEEILPVAQDLGVGVLIYAPFGRTRLWSRVGDREVPDWAAEFDARSWAQFFIKFAAAHPAVTCVTPATSNAEHMLDNLGAGVGRLPDEDQQRRMIELVDALPEASRRRGG